MSLRDPRHHFFAMTARQRRCPLQERTRCPRRRARRGRLVAFRRRANARVARGAR
jgi:hypothetical protein